MKEYVWPQLRGRLPQAEFDESSFTTIENVENTQERINSLFSDGRGRLIFFCRSDKETALRILAGRYFPNVWWKFEFGGSVKKPLVQRVIDGLVWLGVRWSPPADFWKWLRKRQLSNG